MTDKQALIPVEEKTITFYNDELTAVKLADGEVYVPLRKLVENIGLTWGPQRRRINRDNLLSEAMMSVTITVTHIPDSSRARRTQEVLCLRLDMIPGWLFGIQTSRVKEEL